MVMLMKRSGSDSVWANNDQGQYACGSCMSARSQRSQSEDIQHSMPLDPLRMIERQAVGDATTTIMPSNREAGNGYRLRNRAAAKAL
jgi:hypothetical protein